MHIKTRSFHEFYIRYVIRRSQTVIIFSFVRLFLETNTMQLYYTSCLIIHNFVTALLMQQVRMYKQL